MSVQAGVCPGAWRRRSPLGPAPTRYLLYDVNPPEGFNLRRDVYIRMASLLKTLLETEEWVLVLPPWGRLYHWQSPDIAQVRIPWADFFDLPSLNRNIPVVEYEDFIAGEAPAGMAVTWAFAPHVALSSVSRARSDLVCRGALGSGRQVCEPPPLASVGCGGSRGRREAAGPGRLSQRKRCVWH